MVFFVCNACQETLKLKVLEQHGFRCRGTLCCVDCNKDFLGAEARKHTTCISEDERYQKALYKGPKKGGKVDPQELWTEAVGTAAATAPSPKLRELLERLTAYPNVPRKLPKFVNFAKNSIGMRDEKILKDLFDLISKAMPAKPGADGAVGGAGAASAAAAAPAAAAEPAEEATLTGKKRKRSEDAAEAAPAAAEKDKKSKDKGKEDAKKSRKGADADSDAEDDGAAAAGSAKPASGKVLKMKKLVVAQLKAAVAAEDESGGAAGGAGGASKIKVKSLRKATVAAARAADAAGAKWADEDAVGADFDATLAKLAKKGKLSLQGDGKYAALA